MEIQLKRLILATPLPLAEGSHTPVREFRAEERRADSPACVRSIRFDPATGIVRVQRFDNARTELVIFPGGHVGYDDPLWLPKTGPGRPAGATDAEPRTRRTKAEIEAEKGG